MDGKVLEEEIIQKIKTLPPKDKVKAIALKHHLDLIKSQDKEIDKQSDSIQAKYDELAMPIYEKSNLIITGAAAPQQADLQLAPQLLSAEDLQLLQSTQQFDNSAIPNYWLNVFKNADLVELNLTEKDQEAFKFLTKVEIKWGENKVDFKVTFTFAENPYFKNATLEKCFEHQDNELMKTIGTKIDWNDGKNLTKKIVKKKQRNKKTGAMRVITKEEDGESFFLFFRSVDMTNQEKFSKLTDDEQTDIQEQLEIDHETGRLLLDELLPYSLEYFLDLKEFGAKDCEEAGDEDDEDEDEEEEEPKETKKKTQKKK